jgi:glycine oxidase
MISRADVAIVGGGVIGLTAAWFLAKEGLRIVLLDQGDLGAESSWAGAGILPPSSWEHAETPFDRLRAYGRQHFAAISQELLEQTGIDNGFRVCGGIEFLRGAGEALEEEWGGPGVERRPLSGDVALQLEPALAPNLGDAIHLPSLAQLRNPRHLQALEAVCRATGRIELRPRTMVRRLDQEEEGVTLRLEGDVLHADRVILAAGAWTGEFLQQMGHRLPIRPVRGQIALLNPGRTVIRHVLAWGPRYLVPREDGRILVGSTEEEVGFDHRTTDEAIADLVRLATTLAPALANAPLERQWAGLRPASTDGIPAIGPVPGMPRVLVAAGHFRAGFQLSLGTGRAIVDLLFDRPSPLPLEAFRLERFA